MENPMQQEFAMSKDLQQQNIDAEMAMSAPQLIQQQQVVQAALIEQTNPLHILEDIELKLKGMERKLDGTLKKRGEPLMNEEGVNRILLALSSVVNQNTILSHLEDKEISRMIIHVSDDMIDDLTYNWKTYGIKDRALRDHLVNAVLFPTFMSLKRAWKQNEKNWLNKTVVESITSSPRNMPMKKENLWSKFKL